MGFPLHDAAELQRLIKAVGDRHYDHVCPACRGSGKIQLLWLRRLRCHPCLGTGWMLVTRPRALAGRMTTVFDALLPAIERAERLSTLCRDYGIRADQLEDVFRAAGLKPPVQGPPASQSVLARLLTSR